MLTFHAEQEPEIAPNPRDRRVYERHSVHMKAEAIRIDNTLAAHRVPSVDLVLGDLSEGGLAATTDTTLECGERVALFFPSHMGQQVYDLYGHVIRCEPSGASYRIALRFDSLAA